MHKHQELHAVSGIITAGRITAVQGNKIKGTFPRPSLGEIVHIVTKEKSIRAQISSFSENEITITPFEPITGLKPGTRIITEHQDNTNSLTKDHLGSISNALGEIISTAHTKKRAFTTTQITTCTHKIKNGLLDRKQITNFVMTGIPAIDAFLTLGEGQRIVLLAEPGIGKSSLLLAMAEKSDFDLVIFALIGERGREVMELHQNITQTSALLKTIIVASTSDESPNMRVEAAETAMRFAEQAAAQGMKVLLAFDSLTRYVRSLRDVALATGELPIRRGYPASIFENIPKLIERSGNFNSGSITSIFTMLTSAQLDEDPFVEEVKGLTDGHFHLNRELAEKGVYPALDIRKSLSRLHDRFWNKNTLSMQREIKKIYTNACEKLDLLMLANQGKSLDKNRKIILTLENFLSNLDNTYDKESLEEHITVLHSEIIQTLNND